MKVEKIEPKVITYKLTPSINDEEYMSCMWARFIFDCDNGRLNINSDAGDYSYGWGYNKHEDFMSLMARINTDYLLNKIADRTEFDLEASKKETIENISVVKRFPHGAEVVCDLFMKYIQPQIKKDFQLI